LVDPIINFYMGALNQRDIIRVKSDGGRRNYFASTLLFSKLQVTQDGEATGYDARAASRFLKFVDVGKLGSLWVTLAWITSISAIST